MWYIMYVLLLIFTGYPTLSIPLQFRLTLWHFLHKSIIGASEGK